MVLIQNNQYSLFDYSGNSKDQGRRWYFKLVSLNHFFILLLHLKVAIKPKDENFDADLHENFIEFTSINLAYYWQY